MAFEMDATILGGDPIKSELYDTKEKVKGNKFSLFMKNRYMGVYVLDALQNSKFIDNIVVITDKTKLLKKFKYKKNVQFVQQVGSITENFLQAVKKLDVNKNNPVLVIACDLPLLKKEAIDSLVKEYNKYDSDIFLALVPYENFKEFLGICVTNFQPIRVNNKLIYGEKVNGIIIKPKYLVKNKTLINTVQLVYENRELESLRKQIRNLKFLPYIFKNFGIFEVLTAIYLYLISRVLVALNHNRSLYWLMPEKESFEKKISKKYKVNIGFVNYPEFSIDCDTEDDKRGIERIL